MLETQTTRIVQWKEPEDLDKKYQDGIAAYSYLQEPNYEHKREQLFLMLQQGLTDNYIRAFFQNDANVTSRDLDVIRGITMITSEDFVMEQFYKREYTLDEIRKILSSYLADEVVQRLPEAQRLLQDIESVKERFELQIDFLQKERAQMQEHYRELMEKEVRIEQQSGEIEQIKLRNEICRLEEKLQAMQTEREELLKVNAEQADQLLRIEQKEAYSDGTEERTRLLLKCGEMKQELGKEIRDRETGEDSVSFFQMLQKSRESKKNKKLKEERNKLIMGALSDPRYQPEQLDVIVRAASLGLGLQELQQFCQPQMSAANMKILELFYLKQQGKEKDDE